jgi:hypothetical protein
MKSSVFYDMTPCSQLKVNNVSEEHVASIFRVAEYAKHETSVKAGGKLSWFLAWRILRL